MKPFVYVVLAIQLTVVRCSLKTSVNQDEVEDRFDLRCFSCNDAADPMSCTSYETCGAGEECFTRKFTDHLGKTAFRLGCESKTLCNLYKSSLSIIGKRAVNTRPFCFECCDGDNCNSKLCPGNGTTAAVPVTVNPKGQNVTTTASTSHTSTTTTSSAGKCQSAYLTGATSCYLFINSSHTWHEGDVLCKRLGGQLLSINDKAEDDFITSYLEGLPVSVTPDGYWVGGFYDKGTTHGWMWKDATEMTYHRWGSQQPRSYVNYHVYVVNPIVDPSFKDWAWGTAIEYAANKWVICEHDFF